MSKLWPPPPPSLWKSICCQGVFWYIFLFHAVCHNNTSTVEMTLCRYTPKTRGDTVCEPSKKNMFLFISKHCLAPPYGSNPSFYWGTLCQTNGSLLFHTSLCCSPVTRFASSVILWNNTFSTSFNKILPQYSFYIICHELMLSSKELKHNAHFWLDLDPNRVFYG